MALRDNPSQKALVSQSALAGVARAPAIERASRQIATIFIVLTFPAAYLLRRSKP
jgi:hypothetical protein